MKTELAGEVIRASQGQQHQDSRDQKEWNLFIICIESNWFQFISLFHQPLQPQNFIHYPFTNHFFGSLWGTPFANWFGAWNQWFFNKRFKKKKSKCFGILKEIMVIQMKESIIKKSFWIISLLSAAFEDHQTPSGWQVKEWNLSFHDIESNWIQFISLFHQPLQSQNFIHYPFTNHYCGALWGTPFANWFGAWNQQFLNKRFKKKKS